MKLKLQRIDLPMLKDSSEFFGPFNASVEFEILEEDNKSNEYEEDTRYIEINKIYLMNNEGKYIDVTKTDSPAVTEIYMIAETIIDAKLRNGEYDDK